MQNYTTHFVGALNSKVFLSWLSFLRKQESIVLSIFWIPAYAGMTLTFEFCLLNFEFI